MLATDLQTRTDAELAQMLAAYEVGGDAYTYVMEEIGFRERNPEYRIA